MARKVTSIQARRNMSLTNGKVQTLKLRIGPIQARSYFLRIKPLVPLSTLERKLRDAMVKTFPEFALRYDDQTSANSIRDKVLLTEEVKALTTEAELNREEVRQKQKIQWREQQEQRDFVDEKLDKIVNEALEAAHSPYESKSGGVLVRKEPKDRILTP